MFHNYRGCNVTQRAKKNGKRKQSKRETQKVQDINAEVKHSKQEGCKYFKKWQNFSNHWIRQEQATCKKITVSNKNELSFYPPRKSALQAYNHAAKTCTHACT